MEGGCFCGKVRYSISGEPAMQALCHCTDCRKISGGAYSVNSVYPEDGFKVTTGTPKQISKTADGGNTITSHFCGDCGSTMWRDGASFPGMKIIKAGTLDAQDALDKAKPQAELYAPNRVSWIPQVPGTADKQNMA